MATFPNCFHWPGFPRALRASPGRLTVWARGWDIGSHNVYYVKLEKSPIISRFQRVTRAQSLDSLTVGRFSARIKSILGALGAR